MDIIDLVDNAAALALQHASELQGHLRSEVGAGMAGCNAEMHQLVTDIVSLRNAAELLKRQIGTPAA